MSNRSSVTAPTQPSAPIDDGDQRASLVRHHSGDLEQGGLRCHGGGLGDGAGQAVADGQLAGPVPEQVGVDLIDGADERRIVPVRLRNRKAQNLCAGQHRDRAVGIVDHNESRQAD